MERALDCLTDMMKEPEFKQAWDALDDKYRVAALIGAKRKAGMTQAEAVKRMGVFSVCYRQN